MLHCPQLEAAIDKDHNCTFLPR